MKCTVGQAVELLDATYPPAWAEDWDRVGPVLGEPSDPVDRVLCVVDCVPETVEQAVEVGAGLIVAHHPLLLRGVSSLAPTLIFQRFASGNAEFGAAQFGMAEGAIAAGAVVSGLVIAPLVTRVAKGRLLLFGLAEELIITNFAGGSGTSTRLKHAF